MNERTTHQPSLAELLATLIPALILFVESILADRARNNAPAHPRLAATLLGLRALAALFGLPRPTPAIAAPQATHQGTRVMRPATHRIAPRHRPNTLGVTWSLIPGPHPAPAQTLEL